ncbi:hypothetical protein EDC04DRAFT_2892411 [Pisolithus marmoratus]|nr:hypothetical protein EDC04DRAFT_2892411 [Pisolithus marmoratus]
MSPPSPCHSGKLEKQHAFTVTLTVYSSLKSKTKGKASVPKEVKSVKMKGVLNKHGQDHHMVLEKKCYPFRYIPRKTKGQCVSDAMDANNEVDYQKMVGKVSSIHPSMTKIFVDMKQVERLLLSECGDESSKSSGVGKNPKTSSCGPTDLDTHCAQQHIKLQQLHKNKHDEGWTYIGPMGPVTLMPAMILDWCHALEEGQATLHIPPNIESFNVANKATYLHPFRAAQYTSLAPQNCKLEPSNSHSEIQ